MGHFDSEGVAGSKMPVPFRASRQATPTSGIEEELPTCFYSLSDDERYGRRCDFLLHQFTSFACCEPRVDEPALLLLTNVGVGTRRGCGSKFNVKTINKENGTANPDQLSEGM